MQSGRTLDSTVSSVTRFLRPIRRWRPFLVHTGAHQHHNETQAFTPAIRIDAQGNIGVTTTTSAMTTEHHALDTDAWFTRSSDGGRTWSEERLTPESFDMRQAGCQRVLCR
jgi:hypothetical protein